MLRVEGRKNFTTRTSVFSCAMANGANVQLRNTETSSAIETVMVPLALSFAFKKKGTITKDKKLDRRNGNNLMVRYENEIRANFKPNIAR